jgi:hypothetical protein
MPFQPSNVAAGEQREKAAVETIDGRDKLVDGGIPGALPSAPLK